MPNGELRGYLHNITGNKELSPIYNNATGLATPEKIASSSAVGKVKKVFPFTSSPVKSTKSGLRKWILIGVLSLLLSVPFLFGCSVNNEMRPLKRNHLECYGQKENLLKGVHPVTLANWKRPFLAHGAEGGGKNLRKMGDYNYERRHSRLDYQSPIEHLIDKGFIPETLVENGGKSGPASRAQARVKGDKSSVN